MHHTLSSGHPFPQMTVARLGGGEITLGRPQTAEWQLIFVYRGLHCPICRQYLEDLETKLDEFTGNGLEVVVVSADTEAKARKLRADNAPTLTLGYGLSIPQMTTLGLYISTPRSEKETDRPFAEPGLFLINPDGNVHMIDYSNAPFLRPELDRLPARIKYVLDNDYPIRGTHTD